MIWYVIGFLTLPSAFVLLLLLSVLYDVAHSLCMATSKTIEAVRYADRSRWTGHLRKAVPEFWLYCFRSYFKARWHGYTVTIGVRAGNGVRHGAA